MDPIDKAISVFPSEQAACLRSIRSALRELLPDATEDLSWGMPTFRVEGIIAVSFLGFAHHNSLFPGPEVNELLGKALNGYTTTKGTIHLDPVKPPPARFLKAVVHARIRVINSGYPKKSGEFLELYHNGRPKARGKYKNEAMHGAWSFYRKDGSLMRTGSFRLGQRSGEWITYTADGQAHSRTTFD